MNQQQRQFLIDKVKAVSSDEIKALKDQKKKLPNLEKYLLRQILSGKVDIIEKDEIIQILNDKVDAMEESSDKLLQEHGTWRKPRNQKEIVFDAESFFILPENYKADKKAIQEYNSDLSNQIRQIEAKRDQLILRLQLASPKRLDKLLGEVDDMGDLSLFESKIQLLEAPKD